MSPQTNILLEQLGVVYGAPDSPDPAAFIAAYAKHMARYTRAELEAAADRIICTRKSKTWPSVADCIAAIEEYRAEVYAANKPKAQEDDKLRAWREPAVRAADALINCEMGRKAAREGWILGLHDYCRHHGTLPSPREIAAMMQSARYVDQCAAGAIDMGTCHKQLAALANSMLEKRERLARQVLGE
jgi:hypothetical protein